MRRKYESLDPVEPYDRSYGSLFFDHCGVDQIAWAVDRLRRKEYTKSATIGFHIPGEERLSCLSMLDFKLREDRLWTTAVFRSQNIFASHPGNLLALAGLRDRVSDELGVEPGPLTLFVASGHIYEDDIEAARSVLRAAESRANWEPTRSEGSPGEAQNVYPAHLVSRRETAELAAEWDAICVSRDDAIRSGSDLSYDLVLTPHLMDMYSKAMPSDADSLSVLDAGCGSGALSERLADGQPTPDVVGIDPSRNSIRIAQRRVGAGRLTFSQSTLESFAAQAPSRFDAVIGNMLLQNVSDLGAVVDAAFRALKPGGYFFFALPHPCYWPRYWNYDSASWFSYWDEQWIEAPFRTSLGGDGGLVSTHVHRPLEAYVSCFLRAGFRLSEIREPFPPAGTELKYPRPWRSPRFLLGSLQKPLAPT